ncbi:hypothetical protein SAMN05216580_2447 [Geopseudomonas guangdongensis]|uniref:Uncharacterized protein n=1 Tax=Geopseudomonas guangdongensis TaxID=1245526 RepID=A0A1H2HQE1_9GAMM|nr:hypothetical protein SAMN05216580_2447 [Pseudomonas guangdongensis]
MLKFKAKWRQAALAIFAITLLLVLPNLTRLVN